MCSPSMCWWQSRNTVTYCHDTYLCHIAAHAGTTILVSPFVMHRDASRWERAHDFDPERWLTSVGSATPDGQSLSRQALAGMGHKNSYVPFGAGPRNCIGTGGCTIGGSAGPASFPVMSSTCSEDTACAIRRSSCTPCCRLRDDGECRGACGNSAAVSAAAPSRGILPSGGAMYHPAPISIRFGCAKTWEEHVSRRLCKPMT